MDNRSDVREFLVSRRARLTPEQAGLPRYGGTRRVEGLRRTEVAQLAGVSLEYYTQIERGNLRGVSDSVLHAVALALQLDAAERAHLFDLARVAGDGTPARRRAAPVQQVRAGLQAVLDAQLFPAWVTDQRGDVLATNRLGRALNAPMYADEARPVNAARFRFLSPRAAEFYRDWDRTGREVVAVLRAAAGRDPYDKALIDLIGELSTRSEEFRTLWAMHDVRLHRTGTKRLHHPDVGDLDLSYEGLLLAADPGLAMFVFYAEPGSRSHEALRLLASWSAEEDAPAGRGEARSDAADGRAR